MISKISMSWIQLIILAALLIAIVTFLLSISAINGVSPPLR